MFALDRERALLFFLKPIESDYLEKSYQSLTKKAFAFENIFMYFVLKGSLLMLFFPYRFIA